MSHYVQYYDYQVGGGGGVRNVFAGSTYQRGRGVGAWLGGLLRKILPYVASGAKAVGKEAARAGLHVVDDITNNGISFNEAVKMRAKESSNTLKRKAADKISEMMRGSGYKAPPTKRKRQSKKKRASSNIARKKRKPATKKRKKTATINKKKKKKNNNKRSITDIFGP